MLTVKQAAEQLGLSTHGLRRLVDRSRRAHRGETVNGPTIRFAQDGKGGTIRFQREWVTEYLDRITIGPKEEPRTVRGKTSLSWNSL
jgi:hypothetical protein